MMRAVGARKKGPAGGLPRPGGAQTLYQMMLSNPLVLALLRTVRPPERFGEYKDKASPVTWAIYRLP